MGGLGGCQEFQKLTVKCCDVIGASDIMRFYDVNMMQMLSLENSGELVGLLFSSKIHLTSFNDTYGSANKDSHLREKLNTPIN